VLANLSTREIRIRLTREKRGKVLVLGHEFEQLPMIGPTELAYSRRVRDQLPTDMPEMVRDAADSG
jgi:hypothetical protein